MSISYRNHFDIDIDIDIISYRIENFDIVRLKKYRICLDFSHPASFSYYINVEEKYALIKLKKNKCLYH